MPTREEAAKKIRKAIVKLLVARDTAKGNDKVNISKALDGLYAEHARLKGEPDLLNKSYKALTAEFKASAAALREIKEERAKIANAFVTAGEILHAVSAVLVFL